MRALSIFYYVGMSLFLLAGGCTAASLGASGVPVLVGMVIASVLIGATARWLRSAATGFERGVIGDDEITLGQGFRSLRAYLIMFGIFGIIGLLGQIWEAVKLL